jgi:hypothetical protein
MSNDDEQASLFPMPPLVVPKPRARHVNSKRSVAGPRTDRLVKAAVAIHADTPDNIDFLHSVLCQVGLPYRDPGDTLRVWERRSGAATLRIDAGAVLDPRSGAFVNVGLPHGEKPRLALIHLASEAIRTQSPVIEVADSLTAYVRSLGLPTDGRTIRTLKDQLTRLSAATVRIGIAAQDGRSGVQVQGQIVSALDLWQTGEPDQRVIWPSTIRLSAEFFASLQQHAVPLDHRAVAALAPRAMALDSYTWLAQRLHRVSEQKPALVPWPALHDQFGPGFSRIQDFRRKFVDALRSVLTVYPDARVDVEDRGLLLRRSRPPVAPRTISVQSPLGPRLKDGGKR